MIVLVFVLGFVLTLIVSLPNDWARRRASEVVTAVTTVVNVAGIAAVALICVRFGLVNDVISVIVLIVAIALAGLAGNTLGTRMWGAPRRS
jgi:hypothetical protein